MDELKFVEMWALPKRNWPETSGKAVGTNSASLSGNLLASSGFPPPNTHTHTHTHSHQGIHTDTQTPPAVSVWGSRREDEAEVLAGQGAQGFSQTAPGVNKE